MEYWLKVTIGTIIGSVATFTFYWLFDKMFQKLRYHPRSTFRDQPIPMVVSRARNQPNGRNDEATQRLIYEEYDGAGTVACLVITPDGKMASGVCLFTQELRIEYFTEKLSECCQNADPEEYNHRWIYGIINHWAESWQFNEPFVHIVLNDGSLVQNLNSKTTRHSRRLNRFQELFGFKMSFHWTDNFVCDDGFNDELWEDLILLTKNLSKGDDKEEYWDEFVCGHWNRKPVKLNTNDMHQIPHPGNIIAENGAQIEASHKLVDV